MGIIVAKGVDGDLDYSHAIAMGARQISSVFLEATSVDPIAPNSTSTTTTTSSPIASDLAPVIDG